MSDLVVRNDLGGMSAPLSSRSLFDELDRLLTPMWSWSPRPTSPTWPQFHLEHTDEAVVITADVPGLTDADVAVTVAGRTLTIEGSSQRRGYAGAFQRTYTLAEGLDVEHVEAGLEHGVLTIAVPKDARAKARRIPLGAGVVDKVKALLGARKAEG